MVGGRPRADFDQHKDLIIKLYREKTPWSKIEEVLLNEHGCRVKSRTIMRRFKEWDLDFHRVITTKSDDLDHHIKSYWEDKTTRPKTDEELRQRLHDDGFTVSLSAIIQIRKKLNLYRRWDERLGRHRPDSELGKRGRHRQKHSAFTEAKLVPSPDASDSEDAQQPVQEPGQSSRPYPGPSPAPMRQPNQSIQLAPQPDPAINRDVDPDITSRDAQVRALQDRVAILERHCLAHGIGLPYAGSSTDLPSPGTLAAGDRGPWQTNSSFLP